MKARVVGEQLADRDIFLPRLRKLGPVLGDGVVVFKKAAIDEPVEQRGQNAFRRGKRKGERLFLPRLAKGVASSAPDVDDRLPAMVYTDGGPPGASGVEPIQLR